MSSPINNLAYLRPYFCWNRSKAFSFKKPWVGILPTDFQTFLWPCNVHGSTYVKLFLSNDLPWLILFVIWISCWHYDRRLLWQQHNIVHYRSTQWGEIFSLKPRPCQILAEYDSAPVSWKGDILIFYDSLSIQVFDFDQSNQSRPDKIGWNKCYKVEIFSFPDTQCCNLLIFDMA